MRVFDEQNVILTMLLVIKITQIFQNNLFGFILKNLILENE